MDDGLDSGTRRPRPTGRSGTIWTERALIALIMCTLAATANLLVAIHRHAAPAPVPPDAQVAAAPQPAEPTTSAQADRTATADSAPSKPTAEKQPTKPAEVLPPPEDPTEKALAGLTKATAGELAAAQAADQRAAALETARIAAVAGSQRWKRREMLVRQQIAGLTARADQLENAASALDAERDVLAKERDALKAALFKAEKRSGFAVLPYKGPNGTWRRPIVLECSTGTVKLQPKGATFTAMDLSPLINPRLSPLVRAIAHEMLHIKDSDTPDGAAAVPYLVFLVRPSGIRAYYEARSCLEPLGIAFGYELIEQNLAVDIPDFDNLATWDGSVPLDLPLEQAPKPKLSVALNTSPEPGNGTATGARSNDPTTSPGWLEKSNRAGQPSAGNPGNANDSSPEDFVWPTRGRSNGANDRRTSLPGGGPENRGQGGGDGLGADTQGATGTASELPESSGASGPFGGRMPMTGGAHSNGIAQGNAGTGRYPVGGSGSNIARGNGAVSGLSTGSDSVPVLPSGNGLSLGDAPGSGPGSNTPAGSGFGPGVAPRGGSGSSLLPGAGGAGSSIAPGAGSGSGAPQSGGSGPGSLSGGGLGSNAASGSGSGSSDSKPGGSGSGAPQQSGSEPGAPSAGGPALGLAPGSGATPPDSTASLSGGANRSMTGGPASGSGSLPDVNSSGGMNALPDLEPAGDAGSLPPLPPSALEKLSGLVTPSSGAGGPNQGTPPASTTSSLASQAQTGGSMGGSPASESSTSSSGQPSSTSAAGQPASALNLPGGLTSASSSAGSTGLGMPFSSSSSSPSSSSNSSMGGNTAPESASSGSPSSASSSISLGQSGSPSSDASTSDDFLFAPAPKPTPPRGSIEVPFEIVVVCRRNDVLLHPGGYRLTRQIIEQQQPGKDGMLAREIVAMVRKRAIVDPLIRPKPKIRFLVENDGAEMFWTARRQLLFTLPDWPTSLQVSGPQPARVFSKETW
jgi:hypothetical protein